MTHVLTSFWWCDKTLDVIKLKEERFILDHGFRSFNPWTVVCDVSGPQLKQKIKVGGIWRSKSAFIQKHRDRESEG